MLKFPPLKPIPLPEKLIYTRTIFTRDGVMCEDCNIFSTKTGEYGGLMNMLPSRTFREGKFKDSVYVAYLKTRQSGLGFGTSLLNYAKNFSYELGFEGRFHLQANSGLDPNRVPHPFYRKYGMNTGDYETDKELDYFVKKKLNADYINFNSMLMYYPPTTYEKLPTFWEKLKNRLKIIKTNFIT